jgi:hypothetical protein
VPNNAICPACNKPLIHFEIVIEARVYGDGDGAVSLMHIGCVPAAPPTSGWSRLTPEPTPGVNVDTLPYSVSRGMGGGRWYEIAAFADKQQAIDFAKQDWDEHGFPRKVKYRDEYVIAYGAAQNDN